MKKIEGYDSTQTVINKGRLPIGGYVLKILDVKYQEYSWGDVILLSFDIAEGEQRDFFKDQYESQTFEDKKWKGTYRLYVPKDDGSKKDEWTMKKFKSTITAFEYSNKGFHWDWDETKLKGKLVGGIFNNKEYEIDGRTGFYTNCHSLVPVEEIRSGSFKIPADSLLKNKSTTLNTASGAAGAEGFLNIPEDSPDQVPFD